MMRRTIARMICKREGKKNEVRIGDVQEILKILVYMDAEAVLMGTESPLDSMSAEADNLVKDPKFKKKILGV